MLYTYGQVAQQKRSPEPPVHSSTSSRLAHVGQNTDVDMQRWRLAARGRRTLWSSGHVTVPDGVDAKGLAQL